jgi:uncharacterized protein YjdB
MHMNRYLSILLCSITALLISYSGYAQPVFTGGHKQTLTVCQNSSTITIDYLLVVSDANTGTTDTWSVLTPPTNGSLSVSYSTTSTGGILTPAGSIYGPAFGYIGTDSFRVVVTDGTTSDTTKVYVTVNPLPVAGSVTGPSAVCSGSSISLTDAASGGGWSASNTSASVSGGLVTGLSAGIDTISYSVTNSCGTAVASATVTVNASPSAITGSKILCFTLSSPLTDAVTGGTWTSSNTAVATIGSSSGMATGVTLGTATITYTLTGGCAITASVVVHTIPAPISGSSTVCKGAQIVLLDATSFGTWSSSNSTIASVPAGVGLVTGTGAGSATISYTLAGCSALKAVTVYPTSPITGSPTICNGTSLLLSDSVGVGTWASSNTVVATIGISSGIVTAATTGTTTITYTVSSSGCAVVRTETVLLSPGGIIGSGYGCLGATTVLTDAVSGGTWMSDNTTVATIGSSTGVVSGLALGTTDITYTLSDGCLAAETVSVTNLPVAYTVTGGGPYCAGDTGVHIFLSGSVVGVNYYLHLGGSIAGMQSGTGSGLDFGLMTAVGTYSVTATNSTTACVSNMTAGATVSTIPVVIPSVTISVTTGDTICAGTISTFNATPVNGGILPFYEWQVNGLPVGIDTPFYSFGPADGDIVTVVLASNEACARPDTITDTVIMSVSPHGAPAVTLKPTPGDTVCLGNAVTLTPIPSFGGPAPTYTYYKSGTLVGSGHHYSFKPLAGDVIDCYMISDYFCRYSDTGIGTITLQVDTPIMPTFIITANPPMLTSAGMPDTLNVVLDDPYGSFRYQWTVNDSNIHGATNSTFVSDSFNFVNDDSVTCTVTRLGTCQLTTYNWIYVPHNVGVHTIYGNDINVSVLPNPNKGEFSVRGTLGTTLDQDVSLELTDMTGRLVFRDNVVATAGHINAQVRLSSIASGMYLLNVRSQSANKVFHVVVAQ